MVLNTNLLRITLLIFLQFHKIAIGESIGSNSATLRDLSIPNDGNGNLPDGFYLNIDEVKASAGHYNTCAIEYRSKGFDTDILLDDEESSTSEEETDDGITSGALRCWGLDDKEQSSPPPGLLFVQVSCGHLHCCAIQMDGSVACWGDIKHTPESNRRRINKRFLQVSSGQDHSCGVLKDGSIECWGANHFEQATPPTDKDFVQVSSGNQNSCALRKNGNVTCWGKNIENQSSPPQDVKFKQISTSIFYHSCGITYEEGDVICWGSNSRGQSKYREGPFTQVSTGPRCTCGIKEEDGSIECWGRNSRIPQYVLEDKTKQYDQITIGKDHICVIDVDNRLSCWYSGADMGAHKVPLGFVLA